MWKRKLPKNPDNSFNLDDWRVIKLQNNTNDQITVIRIRIRKPNIQNIGLFNLAVEVTWRYSEKPELPTTEINEKQLEYEKALDDLSWDNDIAELVQVVLGSGTKSWLYYSPDRDRFMEKFNQLLSHHDQYPVNIEFISDPDWKIWQDSIHLIKSKTKL